MGRQTTNYKKRALHQLQEQVRDLKEKGGDPKLIKKLNKIKSTIEKIKYPQTRKEAKKNNNLPEKVSQNKPKD